MNEPGAAPSVGVVIPTRDRPQSLRRAIEGVQRQRYPGRLEIAVVYDRADPDRSLEAPGVRVVLNDRTPGLAGARNTGILALDTELIAFCDDDDEWLAGKLEAQVRALAETGAEMATTATVVDMGADRTVRRAGLRAVTHADLVRDRLAMLASSTFLVRRAALLGGLGLVDEAIPGAQGEDWDLLLRAAARRPIAHVDEPLVQIAWHPPGSFFARRWDTKAAALRWLLARHPAIGRDARGAARVYGQIAFAHAATGDRRRALRWSLRALGRFPLEPRTYLAVGVAGGVVRAERIVSVLQRRGRGI